MNDEQKDHWKVLIELEQKSQEAYDTAILALAGGALGVTFTFVKDVLGNEPISVQLLNYAWLCWGASVSAILASHLFSCFAIRKARQQLCDGKNGRLGGFWGWITLILNIASGALFIIGVVIMSDFAVQNIESKFNNPIITHTAKPKKEHANTEAPKRRHKPKENQE